MRLPDSARQNRGRTDVLKNIEGAGKDVKAAGGAVEKAAGGAKRY